MITAHKGRLIQRFWLIGIAFVLVLASLVNIAGAQQTPGQGLEISPPLVELNTDPGKTVTFEIRLRNITQGTLIAKSNVDDFVAQGEEGQPKLLTEANAEPSPYSIKGWARAIPEVRLVSQEQKATTISLDVPADASPGGHYGVVRYTAAPPELEGTGVALSASIGSLVLVKVSGDVKESAKFEEFFTTQSGNRKSLFEYGPISFVERVKNEGNVHFKPIGTIRITNMFGKEAGVLTINEKGGNVLPASIRKFEQTLNKRWMFGRYSAEANIQYGGKNLSGSVSFWVIPYKLIAIVLGALIILFVALRKVLKWYTRRAIAKATGGAPKRKNKRQ